jgi:homoserine kinase
VSELRAGRVRAPGSTSNLGAGFDCVGLAVDRTLEASFEPGGDGLELIRCGCLEGIECPPEDDLLVWAFLGGLARHGHEDPDGSLRVDSTIPVGRGLGSSAAALVAGTALAEIVSGGSIDQDGAFQVALAEEGHGDNAAACSFGGLQAVVGNEGSPRVVLLPLSATVGFAYAAPPHSISTRFARDALPETVSFGLAKEVVWRTASLLRGLAEGDGELLALGFGDRLHAPHRMALIPGADAAVDAARSAGAWGVTVSGAGSGLLAVGPVEAAPRVATAMEEALAARYGADEVTAFQLQPEMEGVREM